MPAAPSDQVDLEPEERLLQLWPGEPARPDGNVDRPGWLVLTDRRLLFFRRVGRWGSGRLERPPLFARRLEEIRSLERRTLWMKIGYGDRVGMEGIAIDGWAVRLGREAPSSEMTEHIHRARRARRAALGLPPP